METPKVPSPPLDRHVAALVKSLQALPAEAVPAIVDCVLATSSISPDTLFTFLLNSFPDSAEDIGSYNVVSYSTALCHLINETNSPSHSFRLLIQSVFLPVLKQINPDESELLNQVILLLCGASSNYNLLEVQEETLIPLCLRSLYSDMGLMTQNCDSVLYHWSITDSVKQIYLQPVTAIHVLASVAASLLQKSGSKLTSKIVPTLAWELSTLVLKMLKELSNYVATAIRVLFPVVLYLIDEVSGALVCVHGKEYKISWFSFLSEVWECCAALFPLGNLERLHAYSILVLSLAFLSKSAPNGQNPEEFVIVDQKEFWQEIRKGLVDRDSLVRKKALYLLKASLNLYFSSAATSIGQLSNDIGSHSSTRTSPACTTDGNGTGSRAHATMTKKERWACKEAKSMGIEEACNVNESCSTSPDRWGVFILLYEMLEEYGTHLVEAAWTHQVGLLIESTRQKSQNSQLMHMCYKDDLIHMRDLGVFYWMAVLWERGLCHENPQVRCLIMESFLQMAWEEHDCCARKVPIDFVLGPLLRGLNDVVHHKDFGIGGAYNSKTIKGASKFFSEFSCQLISSDRLFFVWSLASAARHDNYGRAGLMALSFCIASSSCHFSEQKSEYNTCVLFEDKLTTPVDLLDALGIVIERSKQHFNPNYRLQVCEKVLEAASSLISATDVQLDLLLHFLSTIPREFTDIAGPLRGIVQKWLGNGSSDMNNSLLIKELSEFPIKFVEHGSLGEGLDLFDDEDALAWEYEAQRWARMFFLVFLEEQQLECTVVFFQSHGSTLHDCNSKRRPIKFVILVIGFVEELQRGCRKLQESDFFPGLLPSSHEKLMSTFVSVLENLMAFAGTACSVFWSEDNMGNNSELPSSIKGKLGGPSLRRLTSSLTSSVLQAIFAMKAITSVLSWCRQFKQDYHLKNSANFLWDFSWKVIRYPTCNTETGAELQLAAFESLSHVLKSLSNSFASLILGHAFTDQRPSQSNGMLEKSSLDLFVLGFLESINSLLADGALSRSRRAVLMSWKWLCVESLLSAPYNAVGGEYLTHCHALSDSTLRSIFLDIVESLELTGESSVLSILKCVRLVLGLAKRHHKASSSWLDSQTVMQLVKSSWILHESCNKRRVAPIAALLSAVIHRDIFSDSEMHEPNGGQKGPLKWFIEKLLNEGAKSPRTIRLTALHLTGLWLLFPETVKYYIKELKLLSLYGSVAFDEDFEGELSENQDARAEVSMLAQSPDNEFTEAFINTELYARASVAVLFYRFANFPKVIEGISAKDCSAAVYCGKLFLLELLDSAVNDKDISKELYKKYSSVHRRKVRAWQMICVLSHFVEDDIIEEVTSKLYLCLYRTNLPAVRQYLETFAIQIYLKFPDLVEQQLLPIFHDYAMRTQALSSYVFIAANVILHSKELTLQIKHLKGLLPSIIPLLTSHHHSLRGFTQLLVHRVLTKLWPLLELDNLEVKSFERRCFEELKVYLSENPDCARLRASMEEFFDNFDPNKSSSPAGVFSSRHEGADFECVPVSLMDRVVDFLNEARDDLRHAVANDLATIKSESFSSLNSNVDDHVKDVTIDFQKKITLGMEKSDSDLPALLLDMEKEDQLLNSALQSRSEALQRIKQSQQNLILVASFLDRIPNLAGLARTCEVFKVSGLAIADTSVLQDKQFQLISVTAEKWLPILEVPVNSVKSFLEKKRHESYSLIGLEQTANSTSLDQFSFPNKSVLVLGREKEGIPVDIIHMLDACVEIPQLGIIRSLNVHVSGAIAVWEYTRQQRSLQ
ncbi:tRNA/rRNA methyltransferase (SpoU) family protein [Rhynchospora pubera]|uniref:tRNA (guanosine(18)-2'-O)-methyltransferase TARBP1 n=1 Tax=Rhynchospora pubera TaxID=906938 RepID=A0AAV8EV14_9POAL|nr:tRNA/rRNA methyltransferase (SpoU) family protein [Rhynchospora pubera]